MLELPKEVRTVMLDWSNNHSEVYGKDILRTNASDNIIRQIAAEYCKGKHLGESQQVVFKLREKGFFAEVREQLDEVTFISINKSQNTPLTTIKEEEYANR